MNQEDKLPTVEQIDKVIRLLVKESAQRLEATKREQLQLVKAGRQNPAVAIQAINSASLGHLELMKSLRAIA